MTSLSTAISLSSDVALLVKTVSGLSAAPHLPHVLVLVLFVFIGRSLSRLKRARCRTKEMRSTPRLSRTSIQDDALPGNCLSRCQRFNEWVSAAVEETEVKFLLRRVMETSKTVSRPSTRVCWTFYAFLRQQSFPFSPLRETLSSFSRENWN